MELKANKNRNDLLNSKWRLFVLVLVITLLIGGGVIYYQTSSNKVSYISQSQLTSIKNIIISPTLDPTFNLDYDQIFKYIDPNSASVKDESPDEYTIIVTGDVMTGRAVNTKVLSLNDFNYPYEPTVNFLKSGDVVFINLETTLIPNCKPTVDGMVFCGDQRNVAGLNFAGVTVANVANNHAGNYGISGINSTVELLKQNGIKVTGNGEAAIINIKDKKFGFLGYNNIGGKESGIAWADIPKLQKDITDLKKQVDFVIVTFHWGVEYTDIPTLEQKQLAHAAIDAGADLIVGNHPHWIQGVEKYKGKFITYAHGNYVFDQMWSQETKEGVLGKYVFDSGGLKSIKFIPIIIGDNLQTRFATEPEANSILSKMRDSTNKINK